jgi:hypothetical protein
LEGHKDKNHRKGKKKSFPTGTVTAQMMNLVMLAKKLMVTQELTMYEMDKGIKPQENGQWNCSLKWWKENHIRFPNIWLLAQQILPIPATSAPVERVFNAASNIISKKHARLNPDTVGLLMLLRGKSGAISWAAC